ncbi:Nin1 binding protein [Cyanidiococcus yangmingshanensis]|uniref:Nin1 binding protein n=1 Tax=Cyanidiococcus yangmingshanensis TaxID=2690220 RepID=A0A7J7IP19_9RHOD|nr:Nin1 binding protein [Cyanidiococcus yangmingshanensis]
MSGKVRSLVLDASVWIQVPDAWVRSIVAVPNITLYTVPEVIHEVRDKNARERLQWLLDSRPDPSGQLSALKIAQPSSGAVEGVERVARRTGDYGCLSETDVKVLALALDLVGHHLQENDKVASVTPREDADAESSLPDASRDPDDSGDAGEEVFAVYYSMAGAHTSTRWLAGPVYVPLRGSAQRTYTTLLLIWQVDPQYRHRRPAVANRATLASAVTIELHDCQSAGAVSVGPQRVSRDLCGEPTARRLSRLRNETTKACPAILDVNELQPGQVAVATADYSLQNVMQHLGIPLMRIASQPSIQRRREFIRLCTACNRRIEAHELDDQTIRFCPQCGNYGTLVRCLKETAADTDTTSGAESRSSERVLLPRHMQTVDGAPRLSTRGAVFSIPKPIGGRQGLYKDIILRADEYADKLRRHRRMSRRAAAAASESKATLALSGPVSEELFRPRQPLNKRTLPVVGPASRDTYHLGRQAGRSARRR